MTTTTDEQRSAMLAALMGGPWGLLPDKLVEIRACLIGRRLDTVGAIVDARAQHLGQRPEVDALSYSVDADGLATLEVDGVLLPKLDLLAQLFGGVDTYALAQQFDAMRRDPAVAAALIVWDSPGGTVQGVPAAAAALRALASEKRTVSLVSGVMASSAYWIGSAAGSVYLEGATDIVGSLGVVQRISWDAAAPNSTELVRGKYKRASVNGRPPSAEYLADAEARLDYVYSELIDAVASHRGVSAAAVLQRMADGRLFAGRQALEAGLVDGLSTASALADALIRHPAQIKRRAGANAATRPAAAPAAPRTAVPAGVLAWQDRRTRFDLARAEAAELAARHRATTTTANRRLSPLEALIQQQRAERRIAR